MGVSPSPGRLGRRRCRDAALLLLAARRRASGSVSDRSFGLPTAKFPAEEVVVDIFVINNVLFSCPGLSTPARTHPLTFTRSLAAMPSTRPWTPTSTIFRPPQRALPAPRSRISRTTGPPPFSSGKTSSLCQTFRQKSIAVMLNVRTRHKVLGTARSTG